MSTNKKCLPAMVVVVLVGALLFVNGCKKTEAKGSVELCTKCGQVKGGELCCKPDQARCIICGLVEGSPGCCNIPEGAETAAVCTACGQMAGSDVCCQPGQDKCPKCGLVKGSPGCCKIPKS